MKIALLADLHLGIKKSNQIFADSQMRFFENQLVEELKEKEIKTIVVCGDVFDTRQSINVQTENMAIKLFKDVLKDFDVRIIVGNHDIYNTNTLEVNSLKTLDLLPNVTVYEKMEEVELDGKKVLMLPWITNYDDFDGMILDNYDYTFAHLDIVSFNMGNSMMCTSGITLDQLFKHFNHVYTGHFHCRTNSTYLDGQTVTYIGSPYQLTRIDKGKERGYAILDLDNNDFQWFDNRESMKFIEFVYPEVDESLVEGNVVDLKIPYEKQNETKKIYDLVQKLEKLSPAYPVNVFNMEKTEEDKEVSIDTNALNLRTLFKTYVDQIETKLDKNEIYGRLNELYENFKGGNED